MLLKFSLIYHFVWIVISSGNTIENEKLDTVVRDLSTVSRLVNFISVGEALADSPQSTYEIAQELLGIPKSDVLKRISEFDSELVIRQIKDVEDWVGTTKPFEFDTADQFFKIVDRMHVLNYTKKYVTTVAFSAFNGMFPSTRSDYVKPNSFSDPAAIKEFVESMEIILNSNLTDPTDILSYGSIGQAIVKVNETIARATRPVVEFTYKNHNWVFFKDLPLQLKDGGIEIWRKYLLSSHQYKRDFEDLKKLREKMSEVKTQATKFVEYAKDNSKIDALEKSLSSFMRILDQTKGNVDSKEWTMGLPGGADDIEQISSDLREEWLKTLISDGKSLGKLSTALTLFNKLAIKQKEIAENWKKVGHQKQIDSLQKWMKTFNTALNYRNSIDGNTFTSSIDSASDCFKSNLDEVKKLVNEDNVEPFLIGAKRFSEIIAKVAENFTFRGTHDDEIENFVVPFSQNISEILESVSGRLDQVKIDSLVEKIKHFSGDFKKYGKWYRLAYNILMNMQEMSPVMNELILVYTVVTDAIRPDTIFYVGIKLAWKCIEQTEFRKKEMDSLITYGDIIRDMKSRSMDLHFLKTLFQQVTDFKKDLKEMMEAAEEIRNSSNSRRRRGVDEFQNFQNVKNLAFDLGSSVQAMKWLAEVSKTRNQLERIGNSVSEVDQIILSEKVNIWTDENKRGVVQMANSAGEMVKKVLNYDGKDLLKLAPILKEASNIKGVPINDSYVLHNPIALSLTIEHEPEVRSIGLDFQAASSLHLDFASYQSKLTAASQSILPIRDFFDQFFGIVRPTLPPTTTNLPSTVTTEQYSSSSKVPEVTKRLSTEKPLDTIALGKASGNIKEDGSSKYTTYVVVAGCTLLPLCIIAAIVGALVWNYRKKDPLRWYMLMNKKEKVYEQIQLRSRYLAFQEEQYLKENPKSMSLIEAVSQNNLKTAKELIEYGFWINAVKDCNTCLHIAVMKGNVEMAELLITNGADMTLLNYEGNTPVKCISKSIKNTSKTESTEKTSEITQKDTENMKELFESLTGQEHFRKVPQLLPTENFHIWIAPDVDKTKFEKKYPNLMSSDIKLSTHIVVKTDNEGVYHPDDNHVDNMHLLFNRQMIMKDCWLNACLGSEKNLRDDYKFQLEKIEFKGIIYDTLLEWHKSFHQPEIPYLKYVHFYYAENQQTSKFEELMLRLGAQKQVIKGGCPETNHMNTKFAHPFHHANKGLVWFFNNNVPECEKKDKTISENMTYEDLFVLLLNRKVTYDKKKKRESVLRDPEDKRYKESAMTSVDETDAKGTVHV